VAISLAMIEMHLPVSSGKGQHNIALEDKGNPHWLLEALKQWQKKD
jgi:hypothetical protein